MAPIYKERQLALRQHRGQGRYANYNAGSEEAVEQQGFEFHGDSPFD